MKLEGTVISSPFKFSDGNSRVGDKVIVTVSNNHEYTQAIEEVVETKDGKLWASCLGAGGEPYTTQINFCPFTGKPAQVKREDFDNSKAWLRIAESAYEQRLIDIERHANKEFDALPSDDPRRCAGRPGKMGRPNMENYEFTIKYMATSMMHLTTRLFGIRR